MKKLLLSLPIITILMTSCPRGRVESNRVPSDTLYQRSSEDSTIYNGSQDTSQYPLPIDTETGDGSSVMPEPTGAHLAYSCPDTMIRGKESDINVSVSISQAASELATEMRSTIAAQAGISVEKVSMKDIDTANIALYKTLDITLVDPDSAFKITQIHPNNKQTISEQFNNKWHWIVIPVTDKQRTRLVLKTVAEYPNGRSQDFLEEDFNIDIRIENLSVIRKLWIFLMDHPEFFLTVIIVPLVAFFGRKLFVRKKE